VESDNCHSPETLKAYALGRLPDEEAEALADHVADCPVCEETLAGFDDTADSFVGAVREAGDGTEDAAAASDRLDTALRQIANPYDHDSETTSPVAERIRDYELLEPLWRGGMGTVYRALHRSLDRIVAVKLLPGRRLRAPQAVERFRREMKAIGRLNHPSIVRATDAGEVDGTHYLAMDYVDGIDLSRLVKYIGPLPVADACEIIRQAALALQYAHDQGLIHRDVKPGNLMLEAGAPSHGQSPAVTVKVMDLGLALFGAASEAIDELTTVGQLMGTLDYMAPEQADSSHTVDATADVYSLGATLFKLLTGQAPYETCEYRTPLKKMKALSLVDAPSITNHRSDLPAGLADIIDRMLLRDASQRPRTAQAVAESLEPFCTGHQLDDLLQRGIKEREARRMSDRAAEAPAEPVPATGHRTVRPEPHASTPKPAASGRQGGGFRRVIAVCAGLAGIIMLAAVIWLQTDKGMLKIESAGDQVPVEIRQGSDVVESLTLVAGTNQVQLRSGHYEIVLPLEYDNLKVQNGSVEIQRGGNWIARVTETTEEDPVVTEAAQRQPIQKTDELTYEGQTFDEWKQTVQTERSSVELTKAIQALCTLGKGSRDGEATEAVLGVIAAIDTRTHLASLHYGQSILTTRPHSLLLITAVDQLRDLHADAVVTTVTNTLRSHDPNIAYFVATFLAPQRDWYAHVHKQDYGDKDIAVQDGTPLLTAFYTSEEFVAFLEQDFEALSEELRINYLRFLSESRENYIRIPRTGSLTPTQHGIAAIAMNGTLGKKSQDVACALLIQRNPSSDVANAILGLIRNTTADDTINPIGAESSWGYGDWSRRDFFRWVMLRELCDELETVTELSGWVHEDRVTFGSILSSFRSTTQSYTAGPGAGGSMGGGGSFGDSSCSVPRGTLAAEILAWMGPRAADALPALYDRIAALCGHRPIEDGKWGYKSTRQTSTIPSMGSVLSGSSDEAGFPSTDEILNELDAVMFAVQHITDAPVRFAEIPEFISSNAKPVAVGGYGTTAQVFHVSELNGQTWQSLLDEAASENPATLQQLSELADSLIAFHDASGNPKSQATGLTQSLRKIVLRGIQLRPDADSDVVIDSIEYLRKESPNKHNGLLTEVLQTSEFPHWQQLVIDRFITYDVPVVGKPLRADGDSTDEKPADRSKTGLHTTIYGAITVDLTTDSGASLRNAILELCSRFDDLPPELQRSLLICACVHHLDLTDFDFPAQTLNGDNHRLSIQAAKVIKQKWPSGDALRRQAHQRLIDIALNSESLVDVLNAAITLRWSVATDWHLDDATKIVRFLVDNDGMEERTVQIHVPQSEEVHLGNGQAEVTLGLTTHEVNRRLLLMWVLKHVPLNLVQSMHAEIVGLMQSMQGDSEDLIGKSSLQPPDPLDRLANYEVTKVFEIDSGSPATEKQSP